MNPPAPDPSPDERRASADALISAALAYHRPEHLKELLDFTVKLRRYSPYNALLLHVQDPRVTMVATARDWKLRYGRRVSAGARPLVILAPMHPVLFVFDVRETEGPDLPAAVQMEMKDALSAEGTVPPRIFTRTEAECARLRITVTRLPLPSSCAGDIRSTGPDTFEVRLNDSHQPSQHYATLVHELAHLFLGHVGESSIGWWKDRTDLEVAGKELEAEIVAYLVCERLGLRLGSDKYLSGYLKGGPLPRFSLDATLIAAGKIEEMGRTGLRLRSKGTLT